MDNKQVKNIDWRLERKFKIEVNSFDLLRQNLRLHPAGLRKIFPDRVINNIYFDSPGMQTYKENVMGVSERKKFRVRWYGEELTDIQKPVFEIKIKLNQFGTKEKFKLPNFELRNLAPTIEKVNELTHRIMPLRPVLLNRYRRSYLGTANGKFRFTIDRELEYFGCSLPNIPNKPHFREENGLILELKYDQAEEDASVFITQFLPYRQTKSSKYVKGIDLTWA